MAFQRNKKIYESKSALICTFLRFVWRTPCYKKFQNQLQRGLVKLKVFNLNGKEKWPSLGRYFPFLGEDGVGCLLKTTRFGQQTLVENWC